MSRTKGLRYDTSSAQSRDRYLFAAGEANKEGLLGIGRGLAHGLNQAGENIRRNKTEAAAAKERDRQYGLDERRVSLAEGREQFDQDSATWRMNLEKTKFEQGQYEFEQTATRDAENALLEYEGKAAEVMGGMDILRQAAVQNPELIHDPLWQKDYQERQEQSRQYVQRIDSLRQRVGGGASRGALPESGPAVERAGAPSLGGGAAVERPAAPAPQKVAKRAEDGAVLIEKGQELIKQGEATKSLALKIQGGRMIAKGQAEQKRAQLEAQRQKADGQAAQEREQRGAGAEWFASVAELPQYAGVDRKMRAQLAVGVMQGHIKPDAARTELERLAGLTSEFNAAQGGAKVVEEDARRKAAGLPSLQEEQAGKAADEKRKNIEAAGKQRSEAQDAALKRVFESSAGVDKEGNPVPANPRMVSDADLRTLLNAEPGRVPPDLEDYILDVAVERGALSPRDAVARKFEALPPEQQTLEALNKLKKARGL